MEYVVSIDPGRAKCGLAVVGSDGAVVYRTVVATEGLAEEARRACVEHRAGAIVMGGGTGSAAIRSALVQAAVPVHVVEESHTSEAARKQYLADHPARGWKRLLPAGLRTPDEPYDDYVAVILAQRWWAERSAACG